MTISFSRRPSPELRKLGERLGDRGWSDLGAGQNARRTQGTPRQARSVRFRGVRRNQPASTTATTAVYEADCKAAGAGGARPLPAPGRYPILTKISPGPAPGPQPAPDWLSSREPPLQVFSRPTPYVPVMGSRHAHSPTLFSHTSNLTCLV